MTSNRIDIPAVIQAWNQGRKPQWLARKYAAMRRDPFVFLRGSCHLFFARLPSAGALHKALASWICGDMHLENFGSYKGDNQLVSTISMISTRPLWRPAAESCCDC